MRIAAPPPLGGHGAWRFAQAASLGASRLALVPAEQARQLYATTTTLRNVQSINHYRVEAGPHPSVIAASVGRALQPTPVHSLPVAAPRATIIPRSPPGAAAAGLRASAPPYTVTSPSGYHGMPAYSQPQYRSPTYAAPAYHPSPTYNAPAYHPAPTYNAPAYRPAPTYNAPAYHPSPTYTAPAYHPAPTYAAPAYHPAPTYAAPVYHPAPAYSPPAYHAPSYAAPAYHAPSYSAPSYSAPSRPSFSAPAPASHPSFGGGGFRRR
jgi:hypothetical protein